MVKFAPAVRSTAITTRESQSAPRRRRSTHQAPASATAGLATSPLQRLQALVGSSPRVKQLKVLQKAEGAWACEECVERHRAQAPVTD